MSPLILLFSPSCILFDSGAIVIQDDAAPIDLFIEINSPIDGAQYVADTPILFEAEISEQNNQLDGLNIAWYSSIDGPLEIDLSTTESTFSGIHPLSEGQHVIRLVVTDSKGNGGNANVEITTIGESGALPPDCQLNPPPQGTTYSRNDTIPFQGEVISDEFNTDLTASLTSSIDGLLGETIINPDGLFVLEAQLPSQGIHTVALDVFQNNDILCSASAEYVVEDPLGAQILQPSDAEVLTLSEQILFEGQVLNSDLANGELRVDWFSSLDLLLFSDNPDNQGQSYHTPADLSYGVHTLSFVLFENDIELVSDSISLTINGLPIIETVDLMPLNPQPDETLLCIANAYDEDGGALDLDFEFRNLTTGDVYPPDLISASDATLDLSMTDVLPGSLVQCEVSATDQWGEISTLANHAIVGDPSAPHSR